MGLQPVLDPDIYVFCQIPLGEKIPFRPTMVFEEGDFVTLILPKYQAKTLGYQNLFTCRRITLEINSKLEDIGIVAAASQSLAKANIPCNVVSAVNHDHLFVPVDQAEQALEILQKVTV